MKGLVVGHMTLDTLCDREARVTQFDVPQGAALGATAAAAAWGASVTIVTVLGSDYPRATIEALAGHGVEVLDGPVRRDSLRFWILREADGIGMQCPHIATPIEESTPSVSMYGHLLENGPYDFVHLCPMPLAEQIAWAEKLHAIVPTISVDPQPFSYAPAESDTEKDFERLLRAVTILSITPNRFPHLTGHPLVILETLLGLGPTVVTLKMGSKGSFVGTHGDEHIYEVPPLPVSVVDDTGAGDAYAGSFVASFVADRGLQNSAIRATVTAAVMIERIGMTHVLDEKTRLAELDRDYRTDEVRRHSRQGRGPR
ncbi:MULTISPECIES: carbohydrate kinase family protein [unclassified Mycobacterium]|uniref:carbohydrate kinase family protein n=1 Tax=unclassified Mycobacterium TaxID=2642494 RepID=UPI0029C728C8|nr:MULTISPECIES: PfkB family carbohydrate kinase [unclassified Mycobacterium]